MLRSIGLALLLSTSVVGCLSAQASTITYDLTLTATTGPLSGTGSISVTGPVSPTFQNFTTSSGLVSLDLVIGGHDFSLANSPGNTNVTFINGSLFGLQYFGTIGSLHFLWLLPVSHIATVTFPTYPTAVRALFLRRLRDPLYPSPAPSPVLASRPAVSERRSFRMVAAAETNSLNNSM